MIVVNGRFLRATPTGLHRVARPLLAAARDAGLDCEVLTPPGVDDPLGDRQLPWPSAIATRLGTRLGDQAWEQFRLPGALHGRQLLSLTNTSPLAGRNVVMVHDLAPIVGPHWFVPAMQAYGQGVIAGARRAERVLTVSTQVAEELVDAGVTAPISVIRQAVDATTPATPSAVTALKARLELSSYIVMTGAFDPRKDVFTAIAAHQRANRARPHQLVLIGHAHPVFTPVSIPGLESLRPLGFLPDDDLTALLTGASALLLPSRYEGFGRPPLEAWRAGTPALVSELPSIREATQNRGTYLPPGDVTAWADAIVAALDGEIVAPEPDNWTWSDAAGQLLTALGCSDVEGAEPAV